MHIKINWLNINNKYKKKVDVFDGLSIEQTIIEESLFSLKSLLKIFKRKKNLFFISTFLAFISSIAFIGVDQIVNPNYRGFFKILINDPITKKKFFNESLGNEGDVVFDYIARNSEILSNDLPTLIEYLKSETVLNPVLQKFKIKHNVLSRSLSVNIIDNPKDFETPAQVLNVNFVYPNREKGLKILNSVANTYLDASLEMRQKRLSEGLEFLDLQEPELKKNSEILRNKLALFREENNFLDPNQEALTLKQRINKLDDRILKLESEEERLKIIEKEIKKGNLVSFGLEISENDNKNSEDLGLLITDSNQSSLKELIELKKLYGTYLTKYLPSSELVKGIEERISYLEPLVLEKQLEYVKAAIELNSSSIDSFKKQKKDLSNIFSKQPKLIAKYQELVNKMDLILEKEKALVKARENFQLEITQRNIPWIILKTPFFEKEPINKKKYLFYTFMVSLGFGLILIILKDFLENKFYDAISISNTFDQKLIAEIPSLKKISNSKSLSEQIDYFLNSEFKNDDSEIKEYQYLFYKEVLRNLYANINLSLSEKEIKILSITSTLSGEGKSFITTLLAKILSHYNHKVLIIDSDLRKPTLHKSFAVDNLTGLTTLISEQNSDFNKHIKTINKNLSVLTSGPTVLDPIKVIDSNYMKVFLSKLKESDKFDFVIMDTPPALGLSDYKIISKFSDGLIFLISIGQSKKYFIKKTYEDIKNLKVTLLGIIANFVETDYSISLNDQIVGYFD